MVCQEFLWTYWLVDWALGRKPPKFRTRRVILEYTWLFLMALVIVVAVFCMAMTRLTGVYVERGWRRRFTKGNNGSAVV